MALFDFDSMQKAVASTLGNSTGTEHLTTPMSSYAGWKFPKIPAGAETTYIPVPFPVTSSPEEKKAVMEERAELAVVFFLCIVIWMLPSLCINKRLCCNCFTRWISRRLGCYFILGLVVNFIVIAIVISFEDHVNANDLFFMVVKLVGVATEIISTVLQKVAILAGAVVVFLFRHKIISLLGFDHQVLKADLRDILTGFSMKRFTAIEVSLWHVQSLPPSVMSRSLFVRLVLGYNEPCHTRPHNGVNTSLTLRERIQLNYDEQDDTQKLTISIKQQEALASSSIGQLLPAAGAAMGAVGGLTTPIGPGPGMAMGAVTGIGAANSMQKEIARVDLSAAMINRLLQSSRKKANGKTATDVRPAIPWHEDYFQQVDLVPDGVLWLRIADVGPE